MAAGIGLRTDIVVSLDGFHNVAVLLQTADRVIGQGQTDAWGGFGAMLLREDAGGYVLVGVAAFAAAVVLTVVCMRLHEREKQKQKHEEDAT